MNSLQSRGLTLIELMMTIAIAAILLAVAAPSFQQAINGNRLGSAVNELASAINLARAEAVRQNRRAVLCRSVDGSACDGTSSNWRGWIVFVDTDADGVRDAGEPVIKSGTFDQNLVVTSSANIAAVNERISFRADGTARGADNVTLLTGMLAVCMATALPAENVRDLSLAFGSRTAVRRRNGGGACGVPNDA
ncbi:MAG: GspH/FimT family pseudopilin [Rubrivivax sp.]|jgi:type IV fimbrial biogenesis protein FimT|nr:GspH/FimT family pseudopilin [Rubrivivax sp.]